MDRKIFFGRSIKDLLIAAGPSGILFIIALIVGYKYLDPAPPTKLVISTGEDEGDCQFYAEKYREILKKDGIELEIRPSAGPLENLKKIEDENSDVDVGFVQDGIGSVEEEPDVISLGSLYYEPVWLFYRGKSEVTRFHQLIGKKIAVGYEGRGMRIIALKLLKEAGVDGQNTQLINIGAEKAEDALKKGDVDAAFFLLTPDDPIIENLAMDPDLRLMNVDQAEAITRTLPFLHHLVLPHGIFDLKKNIPEQDINLVSPTATLLARDDLHPALTYVLLKAATQVHGVPGIFEKRGEFPINKDDQFPLGRDADQFYKSGGPFWQKYLPFWLAAWVDRFFLLVIPMLALILPLIRMVPRIYQWRIRTRIYKRYGELTFLETQIKQQPNLQERSAYQKRLDEIEERVNDMKVPLEFAEHIYSLRGHIHFVRERLDALHT